jgi:ribosomal protein S27AE
MSLVLQPFRHGSTRSVERRPLGRRARRAGIAVFFASITVNAALGIYALVSPDWGETQGKILLTSLCVTGAILVALACEPAWERSVLGPVPYAGALLGALGFALAIVAIWAEPSGDILGKIVFTVFTASAACVLASLLALAPLAPRHGWVLTVTLILLAVGATMYAVVFWLGDEPSETYMRAMGVVLVVLAAFVVSVPVLHWVDRGALAVAESSTDAVRFCPHCGSKVQGDVGDRLECGRCGRGFTVAPVRANLT